VNWNVLASTFGLIFVAELGDKTQLAVVTQTCKYRRPWAVFVGASLALGAVTLLGAIGGQFLGTVVPKSLLRFAAALAFVVMGVLVAREASKVADDVAVEESCACPVDSEPNGKTRLGWDWKAFGSTLGLLFVAELGDKTQLAVLSLAGKYDAPWTVFLGGALALIVVTALGAIGGQGLCQLIPRKLLLWASAAAFVVMGVLMAVGIL
jgi:putative Ca2+/H+ antiporter (TMEM165/GDT1 family)